MTPKLFFFTVISTVIFALSATALARTFNAAETRSLIHTCQQNKTEIRLGPTRSNCRCVGMSLGKELSGKKLEWVRSVLEESLSQADFERDPYGLAEFLNDTIEKCRK